MAVHMFWHTYGSFENLNPGIEPCGNGGGIEKNKKRATKKSPFSLHRSVIGNYVSDLLEGESDQIENIVRRLPIQLRFCQTFLQKICIQRIAFSHALQQ